MGRNLDESVQRCERKVKALRCSPLFWDPKTSLKSNLKKRKMCMYKTRSFCARFKDVADVLTGGCYLLDAAHFLDQQDDWKMNGSHRTAAVVAPSVTGSNDRSQRPLLFIFFFFFFFFFFFSLILSFQERLSAWDLCQDDDTIKLSFPKLV